MRGFTTADGQIFKSISEAQIHEVEMLLLQKKIVSPDNSAAMAQAIVEQKDELVDVLTMTENSKPRARKIHGGTKKRTSTDVPKEPKS